VAREHVVEAFLEQHGEVPLPPYLNRSAESADDERYQTVYAKNVGAVAAPTAGLHFTKGLLSKIQKKGVKIVPVTLHVSLGSFRPVEVEDLTKHRMDSEYCFLVYSNPFVGLGIGRRKNHF